MGTLKANPERPSSFIELCRAFLLHASVFMHLTCPPPPPPPDWGAMPHARTCPRSRNTNRRSAATCQLPHMPQSPKSMRFCQVGGGFTVSGRSPSAGNTCWGTRGEVFLPCAVPRPASSWSPARLSAANAYPARGRHLLGFRLRPQDACGPQRPNSTGELQFRYDEYSVMCSADCMPC